MSRRNEVVAVLRITGSTDGCGVKAYWQYVERRDRSTRHDAQQFGSRSRRVVNDAGQTPRPCDARVKSCCEACVA